MKCFFSYDLRTDRTLRLIGNRILVIKLRTIRKMLKKIGTNARYEMEKMLDAKVNLKLWVKVKKDWRDSDFLIKNFGYREEE